MQTSKQQDKHREQYYQRLKPVLAYIHSQQGQPLTLDSAAALSHFSRFHFQRIFSALMGESLTQYSNRVRLERAASLLFFHPDKNVTEIALDCGYSSSANFARSFKDHYGITPVSVRKTERLRQQLAQHMAPQKLNIELLLQLQAQRMSAHIPDETPVPTRIMNVDTRDLCTLRASEGYHLEGIWQCWEQLHQWAKLQGLDSECVTKLGFGHDNPLFTPLDKARYDGALVIPATLKTAVREPFRLSTLNSGQYAVFNYDDLAGNLLTFQLALYSAWLPHSGYEPDDAPLIEHYNRPISDRNAEDPATRSIALEIWLKVKPLRAGV
ncbi:AraC family transcriptional regulator [Pseudoalteromonas rubra]|uniref:AraC family transcriptional regulator n=1 Tax=Pseudoalteromonas rubra TaxID=43658 RepID=A0A5S3WLP2_9GAMM|nr:helix-turn-helix domain-containing protein [Pseudoalteromonas rubra]TMP28636.1 AraC family transcriptional regulator [Pseudoalteromonas rubra]TMP30567.1 AraC family transcriptional regulator [Pseudoalteromonas rubra]